jgi:hypothetical protein
MNPRRFRWAVAAAALVGLAVTCGVVALVVAGTHGARGTQAAGRPACATTLLADWSDGRIDGTYPIRCYRSALKALPSDLQVYSSAPDDIAQALSQRIIQSRAGTSRGHAPKPLRKLASSEQEK